MGNITISFQFPLGDPFEIEDFFNKYKLFRNTEWGIRVRALYRLWDEEVTAVDMGKFVSSLLQKIFTKEYIVRHYLPDDVR